METATNMREHLAKNWGWIVVRGVTSVLFGLLAIATPGLTLAALIVMWGAYAIADGVFAIVAGWQIRDRGRPLWSMLAAGLLGIGAGVLAFRWPGLTALALLMVIAGWALGAGVFQIVAAIRLRKVIEGEWALGLSGVVSVAFGALALIDPGAGALGVLWMIGCYAIVFGVLGIVLGLRVKSHRARKLVPAS
jgi:uncharacterized membrane protein HdeD (DUF308 family)